MGHRQSASQKNAAIWGLPLPSGNEERGSVAKRGVKPSVGEFFLAFCDEKCKKRGSNKVDVSYAGKTTWQGLTYYALGTLLAFAKSLIRGAQVNVAYDTSFNEDWKSVKMRVTYISTIDGKVQQESIKNKYKGGKNYV